MRKLHKWMQAPFALCLRVDVLTLVLTGVCLGASFVIMFTLLSGCSTTSGQVPGVVHTKAELVSEAEVPAIPFVRPEWHNPTFVEGILRDHPGAAMQVLQDELTEFELHTLEFCLWVQRGIIPGMYPLLPILPVSAQSGTKSAATPDTDTELLDVDGAIANLQMRRALLCEDTPEAKAAIDHEIERLYDRRREIFRRMLNERKP
jgi:hypothetical protein